MYRTKPILVAIAIACVTAALPACGGVREAAARQKTSNDIKQITLGYHNFAAEKSRPPADEKEFTGWAEAGDPEATAAFLRLLAAGYKVYWGTDVRRLPAGAGDTVLVYHMDAPTKGGLVGMADGSVRTMTADEFGKAAKPTPPAPKG
jgi:hypothetical protein